MLKPTNLEDFTTFSPATMRTPPASPGPPTSGPRPVLKETMGMEVGGASLVSPIFCRDAKLIVRWGC